VSLMARKLLGVSVATAVVGVLIALYVADWATSFPKTVAASSSSTTVGVTSNLTLQTVAAVGPKYSPSHPDWVSYLVKSNGRWIHSTDFKVPANSTVRITVLQYDGDSGLRNPFLSQVRGTVGESMTLDGKTTGSIDPEEASHTFAVPELGILVPLAGVAEEAKNQCEFAPCTMAEAHRTISFTFRTGRKGRFHWQCFVPCAAGFITGGGGPMQTLGYMDGFLDVV
jgi:hypothetical protein